MCSYGKLIFRTGLGTRLAGEWLDRLHNQLLVGFELDVVYREI